MSLLIELREGYGQIIQGTADYSNVFRVLEICGQCCLSRLVFEISRQVCTTEPAAQFPFFSAKEVFRHIICTLDYRQNRPVLIARRCGVAEEMSPITFKILQDDAGR
jgi:hypothetical protein